MPTKQRTLVSGEVYHVYNRSAGKTTIFHNEHDYERFLLRMQEYQEKFSVDILAFCLMPNHFHLLIRPIDKANTQPVGLKLCPLGPHAAVPAQHFIHRLSTSYSKYYDCSHEEHSGRVFQGAYKAKHVADDAYFLTLCAYIHDNPVRAGLAKKPEEWPWSSYHALTKEIKSTRRVGMPVLAAPPTDQTHAQIYRDFALKRNKNAEDVRTWLWG